MNGLKISICLITVLFFVYGCRQESGDQVDSTINSNLPSQTIEDVNTDSKRKKSEAAKKTLKKLGARITRVPYGKQWFTSIDLRNGWKGKGEDLKLLADVDILWDLYLGPTTTKEDFKYLYVLKEIKIIGVSATELSYSEIEFLRKEMSTVRIVLDTDYEGFIPVPSLKE